MALCIECHFYKRIILVTMTHMTNATLELYHALIEAGVTRETGEAAAKTVITRQEAKETLATKEDVTNLKSEMYKAMMIQTGVTISLVGVLIALFSLMG